MRSRRYRAGTRRRAITGALLVLGVLVACGDDAEEEDVITEDTRISHPEGEQLVLEVRRTGGLREAGADFADVPLATVLGDGTMVVEGAQIEIFPPPILPPLFEMDLSADGMQELLAAADEAGLLSSPPDYGQPPIADGRTTVITVDAGGVEATHEIYALSEVPSLDPGAEMPGLTDEQRARRQAVADFVGSLTTPEQGLVSPDAVSEETPFRADRFAIRAVPVQPGDVQAAGDVEPEVRDWPLADVALDTASECLEVEGSQATELSEALADADTLTRFRQDGVVYRFQVRPLLPSDPGCPV